MRQKFVFQWHITHRCNLRCQHCYQEDYNKDLNKEELTDIFYKILEYINAHNYIGHINFTGGEPLLSNHFFDLLDLCKKYHITFGILTNGTLIDEEIVKKLLQYDELRFVQVSIDGIKETHDRIRGEGNFDKTLSAIRLLKQVHIQTMVSFTCTKNNFKELKDVIKICRKNGVDRFWTDRLIPIGNNTLDIVSTDEYMQYLKILGRESRKAKRNPFVKMRIHTNRALQFVCGCEENCYRCSAGKSLLTILADGTLLPCRRLPLPLGDLTVAHIDSIINNNETIHMLNEENLAPECEKCTYINHCKGGAKCLTYAVTGKLIGQDINCPFSTSY